MRYIFNFPDIGEGLEEGTILKWHVSKGQQIKAGQALVNMETDKIVTDIPSPKTGTIVQVFGSEGETIKVGSPLVEIEIEGVSGADAVAATKESKAEDAVVVTKESKVETTENKEVQNNETQTKQTVKVHPDPEEEGAGVVGTMELAGKNAYMPASDEGTGARPKEEEKKPATKAISTPLARAMAREMNIDINQVIGTGPSGRVTKEDIENYKPSGRQETKAKAGKTESFTPPAPPTEAVTYEQLSQIRKTIARNMLNSKQSTAHMTLFEEVEISELMKVREKFKQKATAENIKLTYLAFIVKATVSALKKFRQLNSQIDVENERMIYHNRYNIAIAIDTPEGLVVPVIKDADRLSIFQIAQKISEFSEKAHDRKLALEDMREGTFTITNYGSIGGIFATPVINYPQTGILGVGRIVKQPVVKGNEIAVGNVLPLSLSVDHRIVDGGEASRFMNHILEILSDPVMLIMETP